MKHRKIHKAQSLTLRSEFAKQVGSLNTSFLEYMKAEVAKDPSIDLTDGVRDYLEFAASLEDKYMREHAEVLTVSLTREKMRKGGVTATLLFFNIHINIQLDGYSFHEPCCTY